ncbi:hypothetical protein GCK72_006537 [Caenorhabditis remanei]|uniref:Uncharacterized protein n=1 Tax=Caenorhabditis remanei TaxID=31234 RepID=A0A6A5HGZ1_CAERE|nr:hypothetical protein GCK72_006537 [Caenorhabditis remanei]KAF1766579.1 hypothetical protein GCK72_006537 [Caenorhabditis remanei]
MRRRIHVDNWPFELEHRSYGHEHELDLPHGRIHRHRLDRPAKERTEPKQVGEPHPSTGCPEGRTSNLNGIPEEPHEAEATVPIIAARRVAVNGFITISDCD